MSIIRIALDIPLPTLFDYTVAEGIAVAMGQLGRAEKRSAFRRMISPYVFRHTPTAI
jgi:hypothetical protein